MILQSGGSPRYDFDPITGRKKNVIKHQYQSTGGDTETRCQQKLCCQKNETSNCRAQQRLINLTAKSRINNAQPKRPTDSSIRKNSVDPEISFIYKVQDYEHLNDSKTQGKLSNTIFLRNGYYEYYPKDLNSEITLKNTIQNTNEKLNKNYKKEKVNNASQTIDDDLYSPTVCSSLRKKPGNCKNNKFENVFIENSEKTKAFNSAKNDSPYVIDDNLISEKADLTGGDTLEHFQQWFGKNEPAVPKMYNGNNHLTYKTKPLTISEALELHERENELNISHKTDSSSNQHNASTDRCFPSSKDKVKVENLKISELHEDFLVGNLGGSMKSDRNIHKEDKSDCNNVAPSREVFRTDIENSENLSSNYMPPKFTDIPKKSLSKFDHDSFRGRNSCDGHQRSSVSKKSFKKDDIQKSSLKNIASQIDVGINKRNGSTKNTFVNPRDNSEYNCNKLRSPLTSASNADCNSYRCSGVLNKYRTEEKKINPNLTSFSSNKNSLSSPQDLPLPTSKNSFISEEADVRMKNYRGFKQWSERNHLADSKMFTQDKQFTRKNENVSRSDLPSKSQNDKKFSDSCLSIKNISKTKTSLNPKATPSKSDFNDLNQNSSHQFVPRACFQQKQQYKALNDTHGGSALTSNYNLAKFSRAPSSKDLKEYNTSHHQRLKNAKSYSDFSDLMKSSYRYPTGKDAAETSNCLAQLRLLCHKSRIAKTLKN